jgi:predicted helicase
MDRINAKCARFFKENTDITSFSEFNKSLANYENDVKGDVFEMVCKLYLIYIYKEFDTVYLLQEVPDELYDDLNLPKHVSGEKYDKGIDGISKKQNMYYALQMKWRSDTSALPYNEVSTFIGTTFGTKVGEGNAKIAKGVFLTNCYDVCEELKNDVKYIAITHDTLVAMDNHPIVHDGKQYKNMWQFIYVIYSNKHVPCKIMNAMPKVPRDYQTEIIKKAKVYFDANDFGRIYMPCGTGKSLIGYWIAQALQSQRTFVAVPSLKLLSQIYETWKEEFEYNKIQVNVLLIGSSSDIDKDNVDEKDFRVVYEITTDPAIITDFLAHNSKCLVITTYQSGNLLADACEGTGISFDLGIYDEAHRTVGLKGRLFSCLVESRFVTRKRLYMTATEKIYKADVSLDSIDIIDKVVSMDNEAIYGKVITEYSIRQAIERGQLVDYNLIGTFIEKQEMVKMIEKGYFVESFEKDKITDIRNVFTCITVLNAMQVYKKISHMILFTNTNAKAAEMEYIISTLFKMPIYESLRNTLVQCLTGEMNMKKRRQGVERFKCAEKAIICSAKIFGEGVDIKACDAVCFADNKQSAVDVVQYACRCLRLYDRKSDKEGHIIVPIVLDSDNENDFYSSNNISFQTLRNVLRTMGATDNRIQERFVICNHSGVVSGNTCDNKRDMFIFGEKLDTEEFAKQICMKVFDKAGGDTQLFYWNTLKKYVAALGLRSKTEYIRMAKIDSKLYENPNVVFKKYWVGWYDLFGVDVNNFIRDVNEWKKVCLDANVSCWSDYETLANKRSDLPLIPDEVYYGFTNLDAELGIEEELYI